MTEKQGEKIKELEKRIEVLEKQRCCAGCTYMAKVQPYIPQPTYYPNFPRCSRCGCELRTGVHYC